ncbi:hypothetical protein D1007_49194 [Hordeum vulgare]|nr:hypothetical protein D1007_49194 [Hordeum vulgare]
MNSAFARDSISGKFISCVSLPKCQAMMSSILGAAPVAAPSPRPLRQHILRVVRGARQSSRLQRLKSNMSSSRRAHATISVELGFISRPDEFSDNTLLKYLQFFRSPMPPENVNKLANIVGLSSPSQLQLPDAELQAILEELAAAQPEIWVFAPSHRSISFFHD